MKIAHLADVHFRGMSRHDEYKKAFEDFFQQCGKIKPDHIVIAGDIVHSKTHGISPELVDILTWWFRSMADVAPTHVILGNHDGLISNKDRQDAISPIVNAINHPQLYLYKDSGNYPIGDSDSGGICWNVFSCFDEENWNIVKPVPGYINIALYHGAVRGSAVESDWEIDGEVEAAIFDGFDFVMLGDIHKRQYLNPEKTIAYPGSTIQQNYGEGQEKGWLLWEIENKDSFSSRFIKLKNRKPFVTLEWNEIDHANIDNGFIPFHARVRIRHPQDIPRAEINQFKSLLREKFKTTEIVTRIDSEQVQNQVKLSTDEIVDLRDHNTLFTLIKEYHGEKKFDDESWEKISAELRKYCEMIPKADTARGTRWSIDEMKFENTFGYGDNNVINFSELAGVVGLFGRNRAGKSSIPGTISYGLFNTSDRGSLKNLHIINTRKNHCKVEIDISVNGKRYRVQRQSVKRTSRAGKVSASTHLNIFEIDSFGEIIKDASGEQRRDTDDFLRSLIGEKSDFFMTSFASQGQINSFIKERATSRKAILTNFLDLGVFESLYDLINKDSYHIKAKLSNIPERNWNSLITETTTEIKGNRKKIRSVESEITSLQSRMAGLRLELNEINPTGAVTEHQLNSKKEKLKSVKSRIISITQKLEDTQVLLEEQQRKIEKAEMFESTFPLAELEDKLEEQRDLERNLITLRHNLETDKATLKRQKESAKTLEAVPCGTQFQSCKFIKKSHKNAKLIDDQSEKVAEMNKTVSAIQRAFNNLIGQKLNEKIETYRSIMKKAAEMRVEKSEIEFDISNLNREKIELEESEVLLSDQVTVMASQLLTESGATDITSIVEKIEQIENEIKKNDAMRLSLSERIGQAKNKLKQLKTERDEYEITLRQWKVYDALLTATSKRGVPLHILKSRLPKINAEIAKILGDSTNFTIDLEAPVESNEMNIYIDYGDSRRPIECASGMEKMLSSLAIRVALINISMLPKSDILIIDEGFGALDESNVEACSRLLQSLKNYFKSIFIISHVEAVKDGVDNLIEIAKDGADSHVRTV
tara:strand:+ start:487 stop:3621 length:3135 start_codon:yes stop_codon:yes gene_type:complete